MKRFEELPGGKVWDNLKGQVCYTVPLVNMRVDDARAYMDALIEALNGEMSE